jgi:hypothetical protein
LALLRDHPQAQRRQNQVGNNNRGQQQEQPPPGGAGSHTETHSRSLYGRGPHRLVTASSREGKIGKAEPDRTLAPPRRAFPVADTTGTPRVTAPRFAGTAYFSRCSRSFSTGSLSGRLPVWA